jgi:phage N-6-adenine-methyltransferase
MLSSQSGEWQTPKTLYDKLNEEFHFDLDPCTTKDNPLGTKRFYTKEDDGLEKEWFGNVFVNPPYNRAIKKWIIKQHNEHVLKDTVNTIVFLLPARVDVRWFHSFIYDSYKNKFYDDVEVRFIRGRLKFGDSKNSAPFPSMIVIFNKFKED